MLLTPNHPLLILSKEMDSICKSLELVNITHFTYQKHFDNGDKISLSNKPKWIEDYYNLNLYQSSLFEAKPSTYSPRYDIWYGDYDLEIYRHGKLYYNTSHSISIIEPQVDGCEFFLFSTTPDNIRAINYLAKNIDILYHFIRYFRENGSQLLKKAHQNKILQPAISNQTNIFLGDDFTAKKIEFYQKTPIQKYYLIVNNSKTYLTQQEYACLSLLSKGKTLKEVAAILKLSFRTVGFYLNNIKQRWGCYTRSQLIDVFITNEFINLKSKNYR